MPLDWGTNWNAFIPPGYGGSGAFRDSLNFYGNEMMGPYNIGAGQLAQSGAYDSAAGQFYGAPSAPVDMGGVGQEAAQGRFGRLLQGQAAGRSAGNAARSQSRLAGATGIEGVAEGMGHDIASELGADYALQHSRDQGLLGGAGLGLGALTSLASPGGIGSTPGTPGGGGTAGTAGSSGLSNLWSGLGSFLPMLLSMFGGGGASDASGAFPASSFTQVA